MRPRRPRSWKDDYNGAYSTDDYEYDSEPWWRSTRSPSRYADDLNREHCYGYNPDAHTGDYYHGDTRRLSHSGYYCDGAHPSVPSYQPGYGASSSGSYQRQANYWDYNEQSFWDTPSPMQRRTYHTSRPTSYSSASGPGSASSSTSQNLSSMLFQHRDRVRKATPPPSSSHNSSHPHLQTREHNQIKRMPSSRPQNQSRKSPMHPTPEYLSTSLEPSQKLLKPELSPKLLILDLNGTLVYRNPHSRSHHPRSSTSSHRPSQQQGQSDTDTIDPYSSFDPTRPHPLRAAHPRPYLQTFREYLFHPSTKRWLDTMVWSSAQPHSVADMVEKCFGEKKEELVAIWARDKLGLNAADYSKKVQTTKDLTKPWNELSLPSEPTVPPSSSSRRYHKHSARTTLLLDDSPLKAHLQPYNHVCIQEYDRAMWQRDLTIRELRTAISRICKEKEEKVSTAISEPAAVAEGNALPSTTLTGEKAQPTTEIETTLASMTKSALEPEGSLRKRKRKAKKEEKKKERLMDRLSQLQSTVSATFASSFTEDSGPGSHHTPGNASFIARSTNDDSAQEITPATTNLRDLEREHTYDETLLAVIGILDAIKAESNVAAWLRSGGLVQGIVDEANKEETTSLLPSSSDSSSSASSAEKPSPKKMKFSVGGVGNEEERETMAGQEETRRTGIPLSQSGPESGTPGKPDLELEQPEPLWFDRAGVQSYWAMRGRSICSVLRIDVVPSVSGQ